jgi:indole-3-acetate monooxygenase
MTTTLDNVRALGPELAKRAEEIEEARRLPLDIVDDLTAAGCFRMLVPRRFGGDELPLAGALGVIEALSAAEAASGWTVMIGATSPLVFGFLAPDVYAEIYSAGPDVIGGGTLAPKGTAVAVDGGYRFTGQWPFASGCLHSSWLAAHALVVDEQGAPVPSEGGGPTLRMGVFPAAEVEVVDTWRVSGLRGTGSHDLRLADAFCPASRTCTVFGALPTVEGTIFSIPIVAQLGLFVAAVAVGIAQAAVDDVAALAASGKRPAFGPAKRVAESPVFQDRLGEADAIVRGARALMLSEAERAWARAVAGEEFALLDRARMRATGPQVTAMAAAAVDIAYALGGGTSLYDTSPLQRRLRDVRAVTQHAGVGRDFFGVVGALLAGEPVDAMRI